MKTIKVAAILSIAGVLALSGCGDDSDGGSDGGGTTINVVGYSVLEQANKGVISAFEKTDAGKDVSFKQSYGASGDQSRAVVAGADADVVHLSLEPDVTRLVDEGLVADDWKDNETKGICTNSVVVFVVQKGNPKGIESWDDLIQDGVGIVTPNPASSGSAKWNLLAAYGAAKDEGGSDDAALDYMTKFFANVAALPDSGRDATTAFTSGTGDVLLSYENEAILARQSGQDFDYVIPEETLSIDNACAVLKDAPKAAQDFLDFQKSADGQKLYAETASSLRPRP
jgi:sulfate transport system substrate-binding protein